METYDRKYFESDDQTRGYRGEGYRDFACHFATAKEILDQKPKNAIELGAGRGYIAKILGSNGVDVLAMDISPHCWHTRAVDKFALWDVTKTPWLTPVFPTAGTSQNGVGLQHIQDKEFDLCYSIALLEHIPMEKIDGVIREMARVSKRGFHAISLIETHTQEWWNAQFQHLAGDGEEVHVINEPDLSHEIQLSIEWWTEKFRKVAPDYPVVITDKDAVEYNGDMQRILPVIPRETRGAGQVGTDAARFHKKINFGCFVSMFYYGWLNVDILDMDKYAAQQGYKFLRLDAAKPLPFPDNYADCIFASHFLEHLSREEGIAFVRECFRILRPGGVVRIATPDVRSLMEQYMYDMGKYDGHFDDYRTAPDEDVDGLKQYRHVNPGVENAMMPMDAFAHLSLSGHKSVYDVEILNTILQDAGFEGDMLIESPFNSMSTIMTRETIVSHPTLSATIDAVKPMPVRKGGGKR